MAQKQYTLTRRCAHDGCHESAFYTYKKRSDYASAATRFSQKSWWCHRHDPNGKNIKALSPQRTIEKVIVREARTTPPLEGEHLWNTGSGFAFGDEWNAYARDFPAGAKIVVETTITVVLPGEGAPTCGATWTGDYSDVDSDANRDDYIGE